MTSLTLPSLRLYVLELEEILEATVEKLAETDNQPTFREWATHVIKDRTDLCTVFGIAVSQAGSALATLLQAHGSFAETVARLLAHRVAIHLYTISLVSDHRIASPRVQALPERLTRLSALVEGAGPPPRTRRVNSVYRALMEHSLDIFRGTVIDTDLWVVLKTLHEDPDGGTRTQRQVLLDFVADQLIHEINEPGQDT